jgi:hypothetical protein
MIKERAVGTFAATHLSFVNALSNPIRLAAASQPV